MKVLYITDGGPGGISSHVNCLAQCLKGIAEVKVCIAYRTDYLKEMLDGSDIPYVLWKCTSGHDPRMVGQVIKTLLEFKPDIVHFHDIPFFAALCIKVWRMLQRLICRRVGFKVFTSIHLPSLIHPWFSRRLLNWAVEPCFWLPVSGPNWQNFKTCYPKARGEVFFNPIRIKKDERNNIVRSNDMNKHVLNNKNFVVGMVGRNADQKDWPLFCSVAHEVRQSIDGDVGGLMSGVLKREISSCSGVIFWGIGVGKSESERFGIGADAVEWKGLQSNGRKWIATLDLFVMTSKHEELPTTVLECFLEKTPICGCVPEGGMIDILNLSSGALRDVFLRDRSSEKLANVVCRLARDADLRQRVVEDGWQILTKYFDAEKNVQGRLLSLYKNVE